MATRKNTKATNPTPDPMTVVDAMRLVRTWTKMAYGHIATGGVEVSKKRITLTLWEILDDGRLRMRCRQYIYCSTTDKREAKAEWLWFCEQQLGAKR